MGSGIRKLTKRLSDLGVSTATAFIRTYQVLLSPVLPHTCRFYPTCSNYSKAAFRKYGMGKGLWLSIRRLCRCHPWHPGGFDPLP
ncbi:MAG: membrane protein insertion efficiency factor YidD [Thermodesulfatator sp.]|nr:MAG: membrane protein insertion efficiency factor YidD [Thermodesulfatator sp.]